MKGGSTPKGFTIVETMIVLAVTAALFVMAAAFISNRQNKTMFADGIRDVESRIQKVMSDVSSGLYPNNGDFDCLVGGDGPRLVENGNTEQGANTSCIFLGKVMQFAVDDVESPTVHIYSLVGLRESGGNLVENFADARPRLIAQGSNDADTVPDMFDIQTLPYGLTVEYLRYNGVNIGAIGFASKLGASLGDDNTSQQLDLLAIRNTDLGQSKGAAVDDIKNNIRNLPASAVNPNNGIQLCLNSGGTNQSALLTIGGSGRQLAVSTKVINTVNCA